MKRVTLRFLQILLMAVLISSMLCGCGMVDNLTGGKKADTAQEVLNNYKEKENIDNVHADMLMNFEINAKAQGVSMNMPFEIGMSFDAFSKNNVHANMSIKASIFGINVDNSTEIYIADNKTYTSSSEDDKWYVSELSDDIDVSNIGEVSFEDATMSYDKEAKQYTIVQSLSELIEHGNMNKMLSVPSDITDQLGLNQSELDDMYKDAKVTYIFDKDYNLLSLTISGAEYSGQIENDGETADISVSLKLEVKYSNHGQITADSVKVPQDIVDSANYEIDDTILDDSFGGYDDDTGFTMDPEEEFTDDTDDMSDIGNISDVNAESYGEMKHLPDMLGSYNGVNFTGIGDSWHDTFGSDGWVLSEDEGLYSFIDATNAKYGDYSFVYAYNEDWDDTTKYDIETYGTYGYEISIEDIDTAPNMTWNGLTFGATKNEIFELYGEPVYTYSGYEYIVYTYEIPHETKNIELEFYVYDDGLRQVRLSVI